MRKNDWIALREAMSWVSSQAKIDGALVGHLNDTEAWTLIRGAAADGRIRFRGAR